MISCLVEGRGSTAAPQQQYVVVYGDGGVTIRWNASTDEAGKPPVSGYELQRREVDSDEWEAVQILESPSDTSLTLTDLTRDETYLVRVRTLNEEGSSEWSAPVDVTAPTVFINVCNRTEQVRDAIVAAAGVSACADVTSAHLSAITELRLSSKNISTLQAGDFSSLKALKVLRLTENDISSVNVTAFSGVTALEYFWMDFSRLQSSSLPAGVFKSVTALGLLSLRANRLNSLPAGIFPGLTSLTELDVSGNPTDPLPITISLELTAAGQFRASAHTGAPFEMTLSLQVVNGSISSGATSIVIPRGRLQSDVLTVTRTAGTTAAVTVDIVSLPALPLKYSGLTLVKSADLPLQVIAPSQ